MEVKSASSTHAPVSLDNMIANGEEVTCQRERQREKGFYQAEDLCTRCRGGVWMFSQPPKGEGALFGRVSVKYKPISQDNQVIHSGASWPWKM
jgi:hypothetical protein